MQALASEQLSPIIRLVGTSEDGDILCWLRDLRLRAHAPVSDYKVAAVAAMKVGDVTVLAGGVNVECSEHRLSPHGESGAIGALAVLFGKSMRLDAIWTLGAPGRLTGPCADPMADMYGFSCGACRQHIAEFAAHADIPLHSFSLNGAQDTKPLSQLLPDSFSFHHFKTLPAGIIAAGAVDETRLVRNENLTSAEIFEWIKALESIDYASGVGEAVILSLANGAYVAGVKVENAAFTGHGATQMALANAVALFGRVDIRAVYAFGRGMRNAGQVRSLSLAARQSLGELTGMAVRVTFFREDGSEIVSAADL